MSAPIDVDHDITDHLIRWSRAGSDGACLDRCRMRRRADQQRPFSINPGIAIGVRPRIVSPGLPDPCQPQRRSVTAAPSTITKSP
jgi:hypothetical protein